MDDSTVMFVRNLRPDALKAKSGKSKSKPHIPKDMLTKWQKTVDLMAEVLGVSAGLIVKVHRSESEVLVTSNTDGNPFAKGDRYSPKNGLCCKVDKAGRSTLLVPDIREDPDWADSPAVERGMISYLGFPLHWPDGKVFGAICVLDKKANTYTATDQELVRQFKEHVESDMRYLLNITRDQLKAKEHRQWEAQVQHMQKLESLGLLAGGIAHDFNNLLTAIFGYVSLALAELPRESPAFKSIEQIQIAGQRAAELTNEMLAYAGRGEFEIRLVNLSSMVDELAHLLEVSISKKALLTCDLAEDLPSIEVDVSQLQQVIVNLITNASDAIGDKAGVISIRTGVMEADRAYLSKTYLNDDFSEGSYVYLEVSDTGQGMDAETQKKIFDPFFTTNGKGRGLGLAMVLDIVRGHHGALEVQSEPGRGSTFKVLFPSKKKATKVSPIPPEALERWLGSGTILLVDDEECVRSVTKQMLERSGLTVLTAGDGREGVEVFREHVNEIDAVLIDMMMPHKSGEEAFSEIRQIKDDARVILCSGYSEQDVMTDPCPPETVSFLQKPYQATALIEKVREVLEAK